MSWKPGPAITVVATDTAQQLSSSIGLVKAIRIYQHWNNTNRIYAGSSVLKPSTNTGVAGWAPPPPASNPPSAPYIDAYESDSLNGVHTQAIYIAGTQNDVILWSYIEQ